MKVCKAAPIFALALACACAVTAEAHAQMGDDGSKVRLLHVLVVGPGKARTKPSQAAADAHDGDVIEIAAGVYAHDAAVWTQNNLTIRGVGGRAHLQAEGASAEGKGIWVIKGANTTIENVEFSGAKVPDENGAGIRQEGPGLTIRNCYFHDNENGILTGTNPESEIVIENSEFANNGYGDGQTHNMYIGGVKRFTLRASYSHHAKIGHNVKSRARENYILYNRIMDEQTGTASYEVEICNGGLAYLIGNLLHKGAHADNSTLVSYGAEGLAYPVNELYVVNNTMVNDYPGGRFIFAAPGTKQVKVINNIFAGPGTVLAGTGDSSHNLQANDPGFVNRAKYDYHLKTGSPAIDAGIDPGTGNGFQLIPKAQYAHPLAEQPRPRSGPLDLGAFEYSHPASRK
jgi:Right handed beta helix region